MIPPIPPIPPWTYPDERYYYPWFDEPPANLGEPSDGEIKAELVKQLKRNRYTKDEDIKVDVKQRVAILGGEVSSARAKRVAGDDAWDTAGVVDVSNQLRVAGSIPPD